MFIRSERLFLRPGWPEEWEELLALVDDEQVVRNLARAPWPYTAEDARAFARMASSGTERDRLLPNFFITLPGADGQRLVGSVGLNRDGEDTELGYWIGRPFWGRGVATEAVRAFLSEHEPRRPLYGHVAKHNGASMRVLEKCGFKYVGENKEFARLDDQVVEGVVYELAG